MARTVKSCNFAQLSLVTADVFDVEVFARIWQEKTVTKSADTSSEEERHFHWRMNSLSEAA